MDGSKYPSPLKEDFSPEKYVSKHYYVCQIEKIYFIIYKQEYRDIIDRLRIK